MLARRNPRTLPLVVIALIVGCSSQVASLDSGIPRDGGPLEAGMHSRSETGTPTRDDARESAHPETGNPTGEDARQSAHPEAGDVVQIQTHDTGPGGEIDAHQTLFLGSCYASSMCPDNSGCFFPIG